MIVITLRVILMITASMGGTLHELYLSLILITLIKIMTSSDHDDQ